MMAEIVYVLCGLLSSLCALILYKNYRENKTSLLLWSSVCFLGLALNSIILFIDMIVLPHLDISVWRLLPALLGLGALIYGFIWDLT